mmetsp:Transcript_18277/g.21094  ORF Transcript_18277/g.21094 Transcript_18277/m.21094 type:complete len:111 (+) Transcript_18277:957-1289(+)
MKGQYPSLLLSAFLFSRSEGGYKTLRPSDTSKYFTFDIDFLVKSNSGFSIGFNSSSRLVEKNVFRLDCCEYTVNEIEVAEKQNITSATVRVGFFIEYELPNVSCQHTSEN